jgi:hypothetical protein
VLFRSGLTLQLSCERIKKFANVASFHSSLVIFSARYTHRATNYGSARRGAMGDSLAEMLTPQ